MIARLSERPKGVNRIAIIPILKIQGRYQIPMKFLHGVRWRMRRRSHENLSRKTGKMFYLSLYLHRKNSEQFQAQACPCPDVPYFLYIQLPIGAANRGLDIFNEQHRAF